MNSFIKYIPKSLNDHKAFVEHLLSIIDTKLQFIKHRTNALISSHSSSLVLQDDDSALLEHYSLAPDSSSSENEKIFSLIEKYSKTTNLLLLLRTKLTERNVSFIYDLLNNDRYLDYDSKVLEKMLNDNMFLNHT